MGLGMQLKSNRAKSLVGLEIAADTIAATETHGSSGEIARAAVAPLPEGAFYEGEVTDPETVSASLKAFFAANKLPRRVRLGIANQRVVVRTLRLPAIENPSELQAAVRFQAQEQVPMPLDQAVIDHQVIGGTPAGEGSAATIDVILVAARREMIDAMLNPLRRAGLQPVGIDLAAFGLIRALGDARVAQGTEPEGNGVALLCDLGDTTNLAVAKRRACLFARVAPVGIGSIADDLCGRAGLTREHARMWMNHVGLTTDPAHIEGDPGMIAMTREALAAGAQALQGELRLSIDFYAAQEGAEPVSQVILTGPGTAIAGFADAVRQGIDLPVEIGVPAALSGYDAQTAARLTLPYGLALSS
jgi:type IV pilus assembly protein PilM